MMNNMPQIKIGIVAVSRDCFPEVLSVTQKRSTGGSLHREI